MAYKYSNPTKVEVYTFFITQKSVKFMQYREGEAEQTRFRAKRIFNVEGKYYFHTREGTIIGPYQTEGRAHTAVSVYIQSISDKEHAKRDNTVVNTAIWEKTSFR